MYVSPNVPSVCSVRASLRSGLVHPLPLAAIVVLVINDHALKGSGVVPAWVTGKLSDFAGLFFFPVLLVVVFEWIATRTRTALRRELTAAIAVSATGVVFTALKTVPALADLCSRSGFTIVCDPSDLIALGALIASYAYLIHTPRSREDRGWKRFASVALAGVASMATSPPPIARGFPSWKVPDTASGSATKTLDCASFEVWVAKSGKTGFGAMLHVRGDRSCTAQIRQATFEYPRERVGTAATLPATITAGTVDAPGTLYLPFAFDNEASWNRGERHGTLKIEIATAEHQETWVVPLDHVHPGAHVVVPRNGTNAAPLPSGAQ